MKIVHLILIMFSIICNEVVIEMVLSDEHKISILDSSSEENAESEKIELEGEAETDFVNDYASCMKDLSGVVTSSLDRSISNITNPFLEIHSPPPELF
ncbi:MAG: hypothetical protein ACI86M_000079 [Saprospiraceae bacterium]